MARFRYRLPEPPRTRSDSAMINANAKDFLVLLKKALRNIHGKLRNNDCLMEVVALLVNVDKYIRNESDDKEGCGDAIIAHVKAAHEELAVAFFQALSDLEIGSNIAAVFTQYRLSVLERTILLMYSCAALRLGVKYRDIEELQHTFCGRHHKSMAIARALLPTGRLAVSGLLNLDYSDSISNMGITPAQQFIEIILNPKRKFIDTWNCQTQERLLNKLGAIRKQLSECAREVGDRDHSCATYPEKILLNRLLAAFKKSIKPKWPLASILKAHFNPTEELIYIALLCRAVVHETDSGRFFDRTGPYTGEWLARTVADWPEEVPEIIRRYLMTGSRLIKMGFIQPVIDGIGDKNIGDESTARSCSYELTSTQLEKLKIQAPEKGAHGRKPLVTMEQLAFPNKVTEQLQIAINQFSHADVLRRWQLSKTISYGRAVTMLFYGPPGVGKTACAEAVAHKLGKRIMVVDYSEMLNCYVGVTPKNIVSTFKKAREGDCVLFWDEADAMFFDRDHADKNWQVQEINVLLQELEKFEGMCILSINRKVMLDKALARRISVKIEFSPPSGEQAREIWKKLLPAKMPLAKDVDINELARYTLTGGEIKNVILNAARNAVGRGRRAKVMRKDLLTAINAEMAAKDDSVNGAERIGFRT